MSKKCCVLLVPFPITPLVAFGYYVLGKKGIVGGEYVRYRDTSSGEPGMWKGLGIWDLSVPNLREELMSMKLSRCRNPLLRRVLAFMGDRKKARPFEEYLLSLYLAGVSPKGILEGAAGLIAELVEGDKDPWRTGFSLPLMEFPVVHKKLPPGVREISFPVYERQENPEDGERPIPILEAFTTKLLVEGRVSLLQGEHFLIAIGGPPGAGKSTLGVSLSDEMRRIVNNLRSHRGPWKNLDLKVVPATFDRATPTLESILNGKGRDRALTESCKRPWTPQLARVARSSILSLCGENEIVVADLPGLRTEITEGMLVAANLGVILSKDWSGVSSWRRLMRRYGTNVVVEAKTGSRHGSIITLYREGKFLAGRIESLDRVIRSWDRAISWMAEILLLDILPSIIERRREKVLRLLGKRVI